MYAQVARHLLHRQDPALHFIESIHVAPSRYARLPRPSRPLTMYGLKQSDVRYSVHTKHIIDTPGKRVEFSRQFVTRRTLLVATFQIFKRTLIAEVTRCRQSKDFLSTNDRGGRAARIRPRPRRRASCRGPARGESRRCAIRQAAPSAGRRARSGAEDAMLRRPRSRRISMTVVPPLPCRSRPPRHEN